MSDPCWGYKGAEGPEYWGHLDASWGLCAEGREQSPIALPATAPTGEHRLRIAYGPVQAQRSTDTHAVKYDVTEGSYLELDGQSFTLKQFHFHVPVEHRWEGVRATAELHLVHVDANGKIIVAGVAFSEQAEQVLPQGLWARLSTATPEESFEIDMREWLPKSQCYLSYPGSLTIPPCMEGVRWLLAKEALQMSTAERDWFLQQIGPNARPLQELGERVVCELHSDNS